MRIRKQLTLSLVSLVLFPSLLSAEINFEKQIWPILEKSCLKCHDAKREVNGNKHKTKGGLRLDSPKFLLQGGDGGAVIVPGKASESSLYTLTVLDPDDDDIMPAKGKILSKAETELIKNWISEGAKFGNWTGSTLTLTQGQITLINKLNLGDIVIYPVAKNSRELYLNLTRLKEKADDSTLKQCEDLLGLCAEVDLSGTAVSSAGLQILKQASLLRQFSLANTQVNDSSMALLAGLPALEKLNLYGTRLSDSGLEKLGQSKSLKRLYLAQTKVTKKALKDFRKSHPQIQVFSAWDLNEVKAISLAATKNSASGNEKKQKVPAAARQVSPSGIRHSFLVTGPKTCIINEQNEIIWQVPGASRDGYVLSNGNILIAFKNVVKEFDKNKKVIWQYKRAKPNREIGTAQRLANGNTMITELGAKPRLREISPDGEIALEIALQPETSNAHMQTRMARKLPNGNYLVPHLLAFAVKEYDPSGKIDKTLRTDLKELG
ncbi:MAG: hypothetical protein HRT88_10155, partial [Lentisphaeraceae bacterium]|nr:hypothetical protein [Lentisphaeraceae bacterium]